jgi:hypothetical protein
MDKAKSIFLSKTFWFNVATAASVMSGAIPANKTVLAVATALNIGIRMVTTQPVTILPQDSK